MLSLKSSLSLRINAQKIEDNIQYIRTRLSQSTQLMAIVKADAYGLGAVRMSQLLEKSGVDCLGIANVKEGVSLRSAGIEVPIIILNEVSPDQYQDLLSFNLTATLYTEDGISRYGAFLKDNNQSATVHLKVDTGMSRIGCQPSEVMDRVKQLKAHSLLKLEGVLSHFANAENCRSIYTQKQYQTFLQIKDTIEQEVSVKTYHIANSSAVENYPDTHMNMVRVGLLIYKDSIQFDSNIEHILNIKAGTAVGYGNQYIPKEDTRIAVVGGGYADGIPTSLGGKGKVLIQETLFPIVGRVCMDSTIIDLGNNSTTIQEGCKVTFIGKQGNAELALSQLAEWSGTNERELMCGVGSRVIRYYY